MAYVIIGVALLLIVAPIFAILPSARQKEQMRLRKEAMDKGISVELTSIDDPIPHQDKYLSGTGKSLEPVLGVAAYKMTRRKPGEWRLSPPVNWTLERKEETSSDLPGCWHWVQSKPQGLSQELEDFFISSLDTLPDDVVKIQEVNYSLIIFWHERSGAEGLAAVVRFLQGCLAILPHQKQVGSDQI